MEDAIVESGFTVEGGAGNIGLGGSELSSHISFVDNLYEENGADDVDQEERHLQHAFANLDLSCINYELIFHVLKFELLRTDSASVGAILVFMPGMEEIRRLAEMVENDNDLFRLCETVPMHSALSFQELQKAFRRAGRNKRKLVISTNICETGVTIEDVDLVLDTGFVKSIEWNQVTEISRLRMHHCSIAEATQRRGRAGRVRPGRCIHLFPRYFVENVSVAISSTSAPTHDDGGVSGGDDGRGGRSISKDDKCRMKRRPDPEIKRAPLTAPILSLIDQGFSPSLLLSAPGNVLAASKLENATQTLVDLGAIVVSGASVSLDKQESIADDGRDSNRERQDVLSGHYLTTPLGKSLALLPCSPSSGIILLAARKLNCLEAAAVFVASLDCKSVFLRTDKPVAYFRQRFGKKTESDAGAIVNVYSEWSLAESKYKWCQTHGISMPAMSHLVKVVHDLLRVVSGHDGDHSTSNCNITGSGKHGSSSNKSNKQCITCLTNVGMHTCVTGGGSLEALHAAITSGVGKNISFRANTKDSSSDKDAVFLSGNKSTTYCRVHATSLVASPGDFIVYYSQMKNQSGKQSLINVSSVNLFTALLFVPWSKYYIGDGTIIIGRGIGVKCKPQTLVLLRGLKTEWERSLVMNSHTREEMSQLEKLKETDCIQMIFNLISSK